MRFSQKHSVERKKAKPAFFECNSKEDCQCTLLVHHLELHLGYVAMLGDHGLRRKNLLQTIKGHRFYPRYNVTHGGSNPRRPFVNSTSLGELNGSCKHPNPTHPTAVQHQRSTSKSNYSMFLRRSTTARLGKKKVHTIRVHIRSFSDSDVLVPCCCYCLTLVIALTPRRVHQSSYGHYRPYGLHSTHTLLLFFITLSVLSMKGHFRQNSKSAIL